MFGDHMNRLQDEFLRRVTSSAVLSELKFEIVDVGGHDALVSRLIAPEHAFAIWRAARATCPAQLFPIVTNDQQVQPDMGELPAFERVTLENARNARETLVRSSPETAAVLEAIAHSTPQSEAYEEHDTFVELLPEHTTISLVLLETPPEEAARPFTISGEGSAPRDAELVTMLAHWKHAYGAEPFYADSKGLELDVARPPTDVNELRALARDFFLLSQGTSEGYGLEEPARLLRRLMSNRWVVWWYGTT
jgi:hypothetical protein